MRFDHRRRIAVTAAAFLLLNSAAALTFTTTPVGAAPAGPSAVTVSDRPGAPQVTAPAGPITVGHPATFTVSMGDGALPISYRYQLNAGPPVAVTADQDGNATFTVTPNRPGNTLTVIGVSAAGFGESATFPFFAARANAADADLTGDGVADLLVVGATHGLPSGLWLAPGGSTGPTITATNIGIHGNGTSTDKSPTEFDGAQVVTGQFTMSGLQDVLAYYPGGFTPGSGCILRGNGDGSPLQGSLSGNQFALTPSALVDPYGNSPLQVANAGDSRRLNAYYPDLIGISGDPANGYHLTYYPNFGDVQGYFLNVTSTAATPTGGTDWQTWTIATAQTPTGTAMFLWQPGTGALHLWTDLTFDQDTGELTYTPYQLATNWNPGADLTLRAADIDGNGAVDLWTVGAGGTVTTWLVVGLATGTGKIFGGPPRTLVPDTGIRR